MSLNRLGCQSYRIGTVAHYKGRSCPRKPNRASCSPAGTASRSKPSWYIVASDDRTVHPELRRFVANRTGATTYEVRRNDVLMLSQPSPAS